MGLARHMPGEAHRASVWLGLHSDGGGSCNRFTPDTRVLMADGSVKAIKDVKAGLQHGQ